MAAQLARIGTDQGNRELDAIIAHANRYSAERIGDVIDTLELYGSLEEDLEDTAVGNYVADRMLSTGIAPAITVVNMRASLRVINTRTRQVIATATLEGTTLQEVHDLITEGAPGFAHLHQADDFGPLDAPDDTLVTLTGPIRPADPAFLDCITALSVYEF